MTTAPVIIVVHRDRATSVPSGGRVLDLKTLLLGIRCWGGGGGGEDFEPEAVAIARFGALQRKSKLP